MAHPSRYASLVHKMWNWIELGAVVFMVGCGNASLHNINPFLEEDGGYSEGGLSALEAGTHVCSEEGEVSSSGASQVAAQSTYLNEPVTSTKKVFGYHIYKNVEVSKISDTYIFAFPNIPIFRDYGSPSMIATYLNVRFSSPFLERVPLEIRKRLVHCTLSEIDIFWVSQGTPLLGTSDTSGPGRTQFWTNYWADPHAPDSFVGTRFDRSLWVGLFRSPFDLNLDVRAGERRRFQAVNHDTRTSPSTAKVRWDTAWPSFALWSLAIDDAHDPSTGAPRAAITLHWLLNAADQTALKAITKQIANAGTPQSLGELVRRVRASPNFAPGTSMRDQLDALVP